MLYCLLLPSLHYLLKAVGHCWFSFQRPNSEACLAFIRVTASPLVILSSRYCFPIVFAWVLGFTPSKSIDAFTPEIIRLFVAPPGVFLSNIILSLIHISEPTRLGMISYAVFCLKKKK